MWPQEIDASWDDDEVKNINEDNIDREYLEMIGKKPPVNMSFEEQYKKIV